jgi:precorrin-6B methylase 2
MRVSYMPASALERLFSFFQKLIFQQIGNKLPTNALKNFMDFFFILFEKIGCKFPIISDIYLKLYHQIVTQEITMAQISQNDKVLVIGSGSLPATPVLIVQNTHAKTVSIDKDATAVREAAQYIAMHHLESKLTIQYADGLTYPVKDFTVVVILYGVKQPAMILQYLANHIDQHTRVVYRTITDNTGKITDKTIDLSQQYRIINRIHSQTLGSFDSFLLMKK